jgi:hypothetical protein
MDPKVAQARWVEDLTRLATERGNAPNVVARAIVLCRELRISPWIALAVAEGKVRLAAAVPFDRAAKCKPLQEAVLNRGLTLAQARVTMPYAPYFLAAELRARGDFPFPRVTESVEVAQGLLAREERVTADGARASVRHRTLEEYAAQAQRVAALRQGRGYDLTLAIEVVTGALDPQIADRRLAIAREESRARWLERKRDERNRPRGPARPA